MPRANDMDREVAVVVLAGGEGRRIGGGKPLRLLGGQRLVDHALASARRFSSRIVLAVGNGEQVPDCGVPQVLDPEPSWGALGGLAAGLAFAAHEGMDLLLTLPCDGPFLPDDLLSRLRAALPADRAAAIPKSGDQLHLVCGLWRTGVRDHLADYAAGGGRSLHGLTEQVGFAEAEWPVEPFDPFLNINSEEDLERAERLLVKVAKRKILP